MSMLLPHPAAPTRADTRTAARPRRLRPRSRYPTVAPHLLRAVRGPLPKLAWIFGLGG